MIKYNNTVAKRLVFANPTTKTLTSKAISSVNIEDGYVLTNNDLFGCDVVFNFNCNAYKARGEQYTVVIKRNGEVLPEESYKVNSSGKN